MNGLLIVASGIIAVYVVLALIVSQIVEWITTVLNVRGKLLRRAIGDLLAGGAREPSDTAKVLVDGIYAHPLVVGLKSTPSYIAPRTFTLAVVAALRELTPLPGLRAPSAPEMSAEAPALLADLRARIVAVLPDDDPLHRSLSLLLEQTENVYDSVLRAIDGWYDQQMQRVTGTFKRYAMYVQIALAALIVYVFHVDTLALVDTLSRSGLAFDAAGVAQSAAATGDLATAVATLAKNGLIPPDALTFHWWFPASLREACGAGITWFAILLGAPFWFDVLKRIVPVRMAGPRPGAPEERR